MPDIAAWKKMGIMGGTFNPIHTGHLLLAQWAMEEAGLDGVLFMPTGNSYMKDKGEMLSGPERLVMTQLAIRDRECFYCSDLEVKRGGNTYTYETLESLQFLYPQAKLYFIVGADCLFSIENWYCPEKIFRCCTLLAASRGHIYGSAGRKTTGIGGDLLRGDPTDGLSQYGDFLHGYPPPPQGW